MSQLRKRLTYANVMSSIAVFVVLGGGAFAATQLPKNSVGTKQLKKNAVTSPKVKNGSLQAADFTAGQLPRGATGATGAAGAIGPAGPQGARGPSNGRASSVSGNVQFGTSEATPLVVDTLDLAAGKWLVFGETAVTNVSGATRSAWCSLNVLGGAELGRTRALDAAEGTQRSSDATVLGAVNLTSAGTVEFRCWANGTGIFTPSQSNPAMQAVQVETLVID